MKKNERFAAEVHEKRSDISAKKGEVIVKANMKFFLEKKKKANMKKRDD